MCYSDDLLQAMKIFKKDSPNIWFRGLTLIYKLNALRQKHRINVNTGLESEVFFGRKSQQKGNESKKKEKISFVAPDLNSKKSDKIPVQV